MESRESGGGSALGGQLLDRERERALLAGAVTSICRGEGSVIVLEGAAGIGKSRLLQVAAQAADTARVTVLAARCEELESALPWLLARSLLAPTIERMTPARRGRALQRAGEGARAIFTSTVDARPETLDHAGLLRRAHALTWLVSDLAARTPLALLVDDLHWADEPSLHFITYLIARARELPVMIVLARRPAVPGSHAEMLERIAGHPAARTVAPTPLGAAALERLVNDALAGVDDPELVAACHEVTGGNPFYVHELLRELSEAREAGRALDASAARAAAPKSVVRSVCLRLDRFDPSAKALARATAILGGGAHLHNAAELAGLELDDAAAALDALTRAEIMLSEDPPGFVHPLVAAAIHEDLGAALRRNLHLRAARLLAADQAELARVALHLLAGGRQGDRWVVQTLREAAKRAIADGAGELAIDYLTRALEEPPVGEERAAVLQELGRIEALLGKPAACEHLSGALELTTDPGARAACMLELGRALALAGDHERATATFEDAAGTLDELESEFGRELQVAWWMSATLGAKHKGALHRNGPELADLDGLDGSLSPGQHQLLALLAQQRAFEGGSPRELRSLAERAWGSGELLRGEGCDGMTWTLVAGTLLLADELELELEICNAAIEEARVRGSPMAYATASYCRSWPLLYRGQIDEAVADAQSALAARADGWGAFVGAAVSGFVLACLERGATAEARAVLAPALADPLMRRSREYVMLVCASARLLLAERKPAEALQAIRQIDQMVREGGLDLPAMMPWRTYASCAAALAGSRREAGSLAEEALASARATGIARLTAGALRMQARLERGERMLALLDEAASLLPVSPPRLERAHVLIEHGAALRRLQRRGEARALLREGLDIANAGGARALAGLAVAELRAAGVTRVAHSEGDGSAALTPSERRVALLAAEGHSNREIAHLLFVTVKTVEYHLGNAYRKLGIKRRGQLARVLSDPPGEPAAVEA